MPNCKYCKKDFEDESRQYCPHCGKLNILYVRETYPLPIAISQISWILFGGLTSYIILRYLFLRFSIGYSILFPSMLMGFIVSIRILTLVRESNLDLGEFFPYYKQFVILIVIFVWLFELILAFSLDYTTLDNFIINSILPTTWEIIEGYSFGIIVPFFMYFWKIKK